ncbi:MAG TPA: serine/threonine-protein kinase [Kofleriaceae bacterium]
MRDDDQPETERGPRWNAKTAAITPRRDRVIDRDVPATEPPVPAGTIGPPEPPARFELRNELGRGGMGSVHAAHDTVLEREVAIKQALDDDAQVMRLFEREAKITAQLEHPSIVPIHDAGRDENGRPYYVMRRLEGEPLADRIARTPDVKARLALVPHVLAAVDAIAFAHARGVIHRDIKPWNILIGDYGETVVIDWGLARRLDDAEADAVFAKKAVGTPGYMAPEQVRGETINTRADVYALGATLLHVLIGKSAVDTTPTEWMEAAASGPAPPTEKLDPEVPIELTAIVTKAMSPHAEYRYADAIEMAADLRAFLAGKLVAAHRYTTSERIVRFVRRYRVAVATATAALVAIAVIAILAIHNVLEERDVARAAQEQADDRAELMLIERASTLAAHDPTRAVTLLRTLSPASRHLRRARDIASKAAANGIAHGMRVHDGSVRAVALAPDGRRLLSTGNDGTLQIHDLITRKSRVVVTHDKGIGWAVWTDGGATIVFAPDDQGLKAVDVASGTVRVIDPNTHVNLLAVASPDNRVRVLDEERHVLIEWPTQPGAEATVLAEDARHVKFAGEHVLVAGVDTLRLVGVDGERLIMRDPTIGKTLVIALSGDVTRAAIATMNQVIEWDLTTMRERSRLDYHATGLHYAEALLYASNRARSGALDRMGGDLIEAASGDWTVTWTTAADRGIAMLNQQGDITFADRDRFYVLRSALPGSRVLAGRDGVPIVAMGSMTGWIRWFDLRSVLPRAFKIPAGANVCGIDATNVYVSSAVTRELVVQPRHKGDRKTLAVTAFGCIVGAIAGQVLLISGHDHWTIVDTATGKLRSFESKAVVSHDDSYLAVLRAHDVVEIGVHGERTIWTSTVPIFGLAANARTLVVVTNDQRLLRVDRKTNRVTTFIMPGAFDRISMAGDGTVYFTIGAELYRVDHALRLLGTLPTKPDLIGTLEDGTVVASSRTRLWRISTAAGALQVTTLAENVRALGGKRSAISIDGFYLATQKYLDTGEEVTRKSRGMIGAIVEDDCVVLYIGGSQPRIEVYEDTVPQDPKQLHAWIETATNAVLEPGSDDLTWR